ncbi:MAG TPA: DUF6624 domain-containing protein [Chitinophagaceae bacterium]|nr:DUF6624 domain-containing protein [Chitinophagaceae bacterium]
MRKYFLLLLVALSVSVASFSQDQDKYARLVTEAMQFFKDKNYQAASARFKEAFDALGGNAFSTDRYNAACAYALAGNADSAFYHLFRLANTSKYDNYDHLTTDADLASLHSDKRWKTLTSEVKENRQKAEANLDTMLVRILDTIHRNDQMHRIAMDSLEKKYGWESKEMQNLFQEMGKADSINVIRVSKILDSRGWLGSDIVGRQGNQTLFLVIQHATQLDVQLKYLPMMKQAAKDGKLNRASLAMLEDRLELRQGRPQIYGSQIGRDDSTGEYHVQAMIDPDNVDKRRAEVGLGKLQDYVSIWKINWDVEAYKKKLPMLMQKLTKW